MIELKATAGLDERRKNLGSEIMKTKKYKIQNTNIKTLQKTHVQDKRI